jgi:3-oxoacyl-[acyl-carrier protein] reductase
MDLGLKDKVAVVLAASSGIGRGIATVLAQEGCNIAICARDKSRLGLVANEIRSATGVKVFAEATDVADAISLDGFFDQILSVYGKVDILVNSSGGPRAGSCFEFNDQDFQSAYELVLMSKIRACRRVIPVMVKQRWGRIINVESTSVKSALENMVLSNTFRSASTAFAKTLSMEYGKEGIRVHTLLSGPFLTNRVHELGAAAAKKRGISFEQWKKEAEEGSPLGRFGDPLEFGALVAFLASERSEFMNGTTIAIDGGALKSIT